MSLRTARVRFFKYRRSASICFFRSFVFADCGHEGKRKSKSNFVCLCGLQGSGHSSIGDLPVNVSSGRMSLRTAATRQEETYKQYCMSLRTARFRLFKYRRSASKCFFRSYVFADCGHEDKRKSTSNIVCLCRLQGSGYLSIGDLPVNVSSGRMSSHPQGRG